MRDRATTAMPHWFNMMVTYSAQLLLQMPPLPLDELPPVEVLQYGQQHQQGPRHSNKYYVRRRLKSCMIAKAIRDKSLNCTLFMWKILLRRSFPRVPSYFYRMSRLLLLLSIPLFLS